MTLSYSLALEFGILCVSLMSLSYSLALAFGRFPFEIEERDLEFEAFDLLLAERGRFAQSIVCGRHPPHESGGYIIPGDAVRFDDNHVTRCDCGQSSNPPIFPNPGVRNVQVLSAWHGTVAFRGGNEAVIAYFQMAPVAIKTQWIRPT
jgi:hypothetical protein